MTRALCFTAVVSSVAVFAGGSADASIVLTEWEIADGGNGNFYGQIVTTQPLDWAAAKSATEASSFMGVSGHLVTITSPEEQLFVESIYDGGISWIGLTDDPAFGGTESFGQPNPQVDGWVWVTGEPVTYTNWFAIDEPNNQGGFENFVTMGLGRKTGGWNDSVSSPTAGTLNRYIIEYETGLVPEPGSFIVWSLTGVMCYGFFWLKQRRHALSERFARTSNTVARSLGFVIR